MPTPLSFRVVAHGRVRGGGNRLSAFGIAKMGEAVLVFNELGLWRSDVCCGRFEPKLDEEKFASCKNCWRQLRLGNLFALWGQSSVPKYLALDLDMLEATLMEADPDLDALEATLYSASLRSAIFEGREKFLSALTDDHGKPTWGVFG